MKPGDHPDFFRLPAPEGRSRESTILLDAKGKFWHDGAPVEHAGLAAALRTWIRRHPIDGRYILSNGYDWTYFTVEDSPFFVDSLHVYDDRVTLVLSDGSEEQWDIASSRLSDDGALYARVKRGSEVGLCEARFTPHALAALSPFLVEGESGPLVRIGTKQYALGGSKASNA
jgi:hypothetical protein